MTAPMPMAPMNTRPPDPGRPVRRNLPPRAPVWLIGAILASVVVILALLIMLVIRDDGGQVETVGSTTEVTASTLPTSTTEPTTTASTEPTTTATTSTTVASTTTAATSTTAATTSTTAATTTTVPSTTVDPNHRPVPAVWPWAEATTRFTDPVVAATSFAEDFVGFVDPVVGPYLAGDSRSGEVEIRPSVNGPVTVVFVRQLGPANTWWVLGAATANTEIDEPDTLDRVTSPLTVTGRALAFEGVVALELRADGSTDPLATATVVGGGTELAPFEGTLDWDDPDATAGALLATTHSAEDGRVWTAAVLRVEFGR